MAVSRRWSTLVLCTLAACHARGGEHTVSAERTPVCRTGVTVDGSADSTPIAWYSAPAESDRQLNDNWCASVGPPVIAGAPSPSDQQAARYPALDSVIVASWNVHVGGGDLDEFIDRLRGGQLTGGTPAHHFIVLLQEVYRADDARVPVSYPANVRTPRTIRESPPGGSRESVVELARRRGLFLFYVPSMRNGRPDEASGQEDRGNAILSTLPLRDLAAVELPFESERRVMISARVAIDDGSNEPAIMRVVCVHLDVASSGTRVARSMGDGRESQMRYALRALDSLLAHDSTRGAQSTRAVVLGGDFNTWFGGPDEGAARLASHYFAQPVSSRAEVTVDGWRGMFARKLDYLFFRLPTGYEARQHKWPNRFGSDHYPLVGGVGKAASVAAVEGAESGKRKAESR